MKNTIKSTLLASVLGLLALPAALNAQVLVESVVAGNPTFDDPADTGTFAFDASGSNYILVAASSRNSVDSATYNGAPMTQIHLFNDSGQNEGFGIWGLANPTAGSNDVVIQYASGSPDGRNVVAVYGLSNVDTSIGGSLIDNNNNGDSVSGNPTLAGASLFGFAGTNGGSDVTSFTITGGTASNEIFQENTTSIGGSAVLSTSTATTYTFDANTGDYGALVQVAAIPEPSTAALLLGVGAFAFLLSNRRRRAA